MAGWESCLLLLVTTGVLVSVVTAEPLEPSLEVFCIRQLIPDTPILSYRCGIQPPLSGVTLSCDIDGEPLESCEVLQIDPRLYEAGIRFIITVVATASDGRANSTSFNFVGTGPDVINVFMDPRDITITEPSLIVFSFITITVSGPGFFTPSVNVNLRPLTYGQYAALGGNVDQEFPSRPQQAAEAQNDFNITVRPIRATGPYLVSLDNLVFSDRIDEPDEGFILYLEVDTERTTLDSSSVIVINNNATLVIIQNVLPFTLLCGSGGGSRALQVQCGTLNALGLVTYTCDIDGSPIPCDNGTVSIRFSDYPRGMYILTITANDFTGKRESEQFRFNVTTGIVDEPDLICVEQVIADAPIRQFTCRVEPPTDVVITCSIDGGESFACDGNIQVDLRRYAPGNHTIEVDASFPDHSGIIRQLNFMGIGPDVITVDMSPRNVRVIEGIFSFPEIELGSFGPGFIVPTVYVNILPLTYTQFSAIGGNLDQDFLFRPQIAAEASDFNSSPASLEIVGNSANLFSASALVIADGITEVEEGFILYLEVDTNRTNLGELAVVRLSNRATLVNITELSAIDLVCTSRLEGFDLSVICEFSREAGNVSFSCDIDGEISIPCDSASVTLDVNDYSVGMHELRITAINSFSFVSYFASFTTPAVTEPLQVICVRRIVIISPVKSYRCGVQPPLSGVTLSCDIDGKPLENCEILRVDPRLYGAGTRFLITVMATAPDGRTNSTSFDFMGTGPDMINVFMDPRNITIADRSLMVFNFITITVSGSGFSLPTFYVNLRPLTYGQYAAQGGDVDQQFPSRPPAAAQAQNDFNSTVRPIRATSVVLHSLDNLVFSDQIEESDEGFILYLEVDTERTSLDNSSVIVVNNNATLVIIQNVSSINLACTSRLEGFDLSVICEFSREAGDVSFSCIVDGGISIPCDSASVSLDVSDYFVGMHELRIIASNSFSVELYDVSFTTPTELLTINCQFAETGFSLSVDCQTAGGVEPVMFNCRVDDTAVSCEFVNGSVALRIDEYTVGLHNLTITASDQFQNIASEVYNFTTLPVLELSCDYIQVESILAVNCSATGIQGLFLFSCGVEFFPVECINGSVALNTSAYSVGPHKLSILIFDEGGNIDSEEITFVTAPICESAILLGADVRVFCTTVFPVTSVICSYDGGALVENCAVNYIINISRFGQGSHELSITITDTEPRSTTIDISFFVPQPLEVTCTDVRQTTMFAIVECRANNNLTDGQCNIDGGIFTCSLTSISIPYSTQTEGSHILAFRVIDTYQQISAVVTRNYIVPDLDIFFVEDTPIIEAGSIYARFEANRNMSNMIITCQLIGSVDDRANTPKEDCISGVYNRTSLPDRTYILRLEAQLQGQRRAIRRRIPILPVSCSAYLINRGVSIENSIITIEFRGSGGATNFACLLDGATLIDPCTSPVTLNNLASGRHKFAIRPQGCAVRLTYAFIFIVP